MQKIISTILSLPLLYLLNIFLTFSLILIQLVFTVFNGEAWGYLGSRKFLQELDEGAASVNGISSLMIDEVLEIGSVGKAILEEYPSFYVHTEGVRIFGSAL
ncbi:Nicastrin [Zea mays]|uniref:Nicastrin n=1 Tax=Zea mays TaxID=4577 RepID=A0A1D6LI71_MAIZE|nr:Nicastrin [Zea mays]